MFMYTFFYIQGMVERLETQLGHLRFSFETMSIKLRRDHSSVYKKLQQQHESVLKKLDDIKCTIDVISKRQAPEIEMEEMYEQAILSLRKLTIPLEDITASNLPDCVKPLHLKTTYTFGMYRIFKKLLCSVSF